MVGKYLQIGQDRLFANPPFAINNRFEISNRFLAHGLLISLMMDSASTCETSVTSTGLRGGTTQKTAFFKFNGVLGPLFPTRKLLLVRGNKQFGPPSFIQFPG
jgi:hypothetical protein